LSGIIKLSIKREMEKELERKMQRDRQREREKKYSVNVYCIIIVVLKLG